MFHKFNFIVPLYLCFELNRGCIVNINPVTCAFVNGLDRPHSVLKSKFQPTITMYINI